MTHYSVTLAPRASVLLLVTPPGAARFQAEVGAWAGSARFENTFTGHVGMGYVTGLDTEGSSVAVAVAVPAAGVHTLLCRVANATGKAASLSVRALDPENGNVRGTDTLHVPSASAWTTWQTIPVVLRMAKGANLVVFSVDGSHHGGINLDSFTLV